MKHNFFYFFLSLILLNQVSFSQNTSVNLDNYITVTYIGGAGILLESGNDKVLIDAFFTSGGVSGFMSPSNDDYSNIKSALPPFDNIDVYLVGHSHEDHFSAAIMDECMVNNKTAKLICPKDAAESLKNLSSGNYSTYSNRITSPELGDYEYTDKTLNYIKVKITQFPAFSYHPYGVMNFNIEVGNFKLLFLMGSLQSADTYSKPFNPADNDILLVTSSYAENTTVLENSLNYKIAYVHHLYKYSSQMTVFSNRCEDLRSKGKEVYMFKSAMEQHILQKSGDSIIMDATIPVAIKHTTTNPEISFYPNPAQNKVLIDFNNDFTVIKADILDMSGKILISKTIQQKKEGEINLSGLKKGIYIVRINCDDMAIVTKKLILK